MAARFQQRQERHRSYTAEAEYGFTPSWQSELEFDSPARPVPARYVFTRLTSENLFRFTGRGEYWGIRLSRGTAGDSRESNETTFGPVLRKDFWGLSIDRPVRRKDLGVSASGRPQLFWAWETRVEAWQVTWGRHFAVEPGFQ